MELAGSSVETTSCEVCGNIDLRSVIDLGQHPMCDDLVAIGNDRVCKEFPIEILFCDHCCTAHQRFQIPKKELFPATYHYRSRHTADVLNGMKALVAACEEFYGTLSSKKVLDIGCNDGSLLSFFVEKGAIPFGIEPTGAASDAAQRGYTILNEFFSETVAEDFVQRHGRPDIVTFTNVFAHIEDLKAVVRALQIVCHAQTLIVIENHYLGAILEKNQFDTFYHEHPRTYSFTSFVHIAKSLGREIVRAEFPKRYGGNIRIFMGLRQSQSHSEELGSILRTEQSFGEGLDRLAENISVWRDNKLDDVRRIVAQHGPIRAKAFPGRAAIPVKILGLTTANISASYEKPGSAKVGHYIPGTSIPIESDDDFSLGGSDAPPLLNLAWHISDEISQYLRQRGYAGKIIDIISPADFLKRTI
jgi:hypothetical protein